MKRCSLARRGLQAFPKHFSAPFLAPSLFMALFGAAALLAAPHAHAQNNTGATAAATPLDQRVRQFPADAVRGVLQVGAANVIRMDGKPDRLAPGARIRDSQNRIVLTGALIGQTLRVNYTRETGGQVHEVWILSAEEAAQKRAGNNDLVQRNFRFASEE